MLGVTPGAGFDLARRRPLAAALDAVDGQDVRRGAAGLSLPDSRRAGDLPHLRRAAPGLPVVVLTGLDDDPWRCRPSREAPRIIW